MAKAKWFPPFIVLASNESLTSTLAPTSPSLKRLMSLFSVSPRKSLLFLRLPLARQDGSTIWNTSIDRLSKIEVNVIYQNKPNDISNQTKEISEISHNYGVSDEADLIMQDGQNLGQTKEPFKKAQKPGRNEPCWCGSGKKYKSCHWPN